MMETKDLVQRGKESFDKKDYETAEKFLRKAHKSSPQYADVLNMLGVVCQVKGDYEEAIDFFQAALKINPNYTEAILNLAVLYNDLGKYKDAKKLYEALSQKPKKTKRGIDPVLGGKLSNLHADIGDIYRSIGMYDKAIEEYKKALDLNPDYHDIRTRLGRTLRDAGDLKASEKELKHVVLKKKTYVPAKIQLGITDYALGNSNAAKKNWASALKTDPENGYAKMYLRLINS